jgi:PTH1 family peptidyl-tRNA hydrolase
MESILRSLATDQIARLRLGIGDGAPRPGGEGLADFVLSPFEPEELEIVENMCVSATDACESWLKKGIQEAMNEFNS